MILLVYFSNKPGFKKINLLLRRAGKLVGLGLFSAGWAGHGG